MLTVFMLSFIILKVNVVILSVVMLSVAMLSVIMLNVAAPVAHLNEHQFEVNHPPIFWPLLILKYKMPFGPTSFEQLTSCRKSHCTPPPPV
jgi:hypothetical protein